jgi:hypothetical protein
MKTALQIFWGEFRGKYQGWFTLAIALIAVGLWVLSPFISEISPKLATGVSLSTLVVILAMALDHLVTIRKELHLAKFYPDQMSADDDTLGLIQTEKAQLIEYSSWTASRVLYRLKEMKAEIELLICNPNFTITNAQERSFHSPRPGSKDFQKELRVCPAIRQLGNTILRGYDKVKIKCYRTPGSLRGRNFGDRWIQIGWYTYQSDGDRKTFGSPQIWGDNNTLITAPTSSTEGLALKNMFNRVFEKMWDESVPLKAVCGRCSKKADCFGSKEVAKEWLELVS